MSDADVNATLWNRRGSAQRMICGEWQGIILMAPLTFLL